MEQKYKELIAKEQAGFVRGKGTREQIVNFRIKIEKLKECNVPLYICASSIMLKRLIASVTDSYGTS